MTEIKCIYCIEEYLAIPEDDEQRLSGEAWPKVREADTFVPTWQQIQMQPGQIAFGVTTVPVCIHHIKVQRPTAEQIASRSGLIVPA